MVRGTGGTCAETVSGVAGRVADIVCPQKVLNKYCIWREGGVSRLETKPGIMNRSSAEEIPVGLHRNLAVLAIGGMAE